LRRYRQLSVFPNQKEHCKKAESKAHRADQHLPRIRRERMRECVVSRDGSERQHQDGKNQKKRSKSPNCASAQPQ
jgi:hypothetical protein